MCCHQNGEMEKLDIRVGKSYRDHGKKIYVEVLGVMIVYCDTITKEGDTCIRLESDGKTIGFINLNHFNFEDVEQLINSK